MVINLKLILKSHEFSATITVQKYNNAHKTATNNIDSNNSVQKLRKP